MSTNLLDKTSVHSVPLPGSGVVLTFMLDVLKLYQITPKDNQPLLYHRMIEAFKWGYGYRSKLGDPYDEEYRDNITEVCKRFLLLFCYLYINIYSKVNKIKTFKKIIRCSGI